MNRHTFIAAASKAEQPPLSRGNQLTPCEAKTSANHRYGPLTTSDMAGAGGPFNKFDNDIAAARRRGNPLLAARLQEARARINLSFGVLEPVWIATDHQRVMLALRACPTGLRVMDAKVAA